MYLQTGNYIHATNEVEISTISKRVVYSRRGFPQYTHVVWGIHGVLHSTDNTIATLTVQMAVLEASYNGQTFQDVGLFNDNGSATEHGLLGAASFGGVRVTGFHWGPSRGAEYTTYRSYSATLEADYPGSENLIEWQETVSIRGTGGPRNIWLPCLEGEPQQQMVQVQTTVKATQSGHAVGLFSYPEFNQPYWGPEVEQEENEVQDQGSPDQVGPNRWNFPIKWSYTFEGLQLDGGTPQMP